MTEHIPRAHTSPADRAARAYRIKRGAGGVVRLRGRCHPQSNHGVSMPQAWPVRWFTLLWPSTSHVNK